MNVLDVADEAVRPLERDEVCKDRADSADEEEERQSCRRGEEGEKRDSQRTSNMTSRCSAEEMLNPRTEHSRGSLYANPTTQTSF